MALRYYWAIVEKSTDGFYAFLPDLPGATAAGDSVEEALRWLAEIAADHIRDAKERGGMSPPDATKLEDIAHDPEAPEYGRVLLQVELPAKAVKISVTIDEGVLARIDRAASEAPPHRSTASTSGATAAAGGNDRSNARTGTRIRRALASAPGRIPMSKTPTTAVARKSKRKEVVSAVTGPVAFMHADDIGKLVVPGSKRTGVRLQPNYSTQEDGVDTVKVLMATDTVIAFEAFRPKGAIDTAHQHPDHHSMVYQKQGRTRMRIGDETFIVEAGDSYFHPLGVVHQHEALEDSIRIETKIYPNGGAIQSWNRLVGG